MADTVKAIPDASGAVAVKPPVTPVATPPKPIPTDLTAIRSPEELRKIAEGSVGEELAGAINPLKSQIGTLQTQEEGAVKGINDMFGTILPFAAGAAERVGTAYDTAEAQQQGIMAAATGRMNQLRQTRAQEAQALAQEMGGPVSVGEFTSSMGYEPEALANLGAGQQLHTLMYGLADVGTANAFAGRVLPLVQTEETAKARSFYEDRVQELQKEITTLESTKSSKVSAKVNDLLIAERTFQLQKSQQQLDKIKADHDWQATLRTLKNEEARIDLARQQFKLERAGVTGTLNGKPTLEAKKLTSAEKQQAAALGLSEREFQLKKKELSQASTLASKKLAIAQKNTWAQYLDVALNPQVGKTVKTSHSVPVSASAAYGKVKDAYKDKSSPTGWSKIVTTVETPVSDPISDPTQLVDYLVAHGAPQSVAVNMVKRRLGLADNWKYGQKPGAAPPSADSPNRP